MRKSIRRRYKHGIWPILPIPIHKEECLLLNIEVRAVGYKYKISCELYPVYEMHHAPDD